MVLQSKPTGSQSSKRQSCVRHVRLAQLAVLVVSGCNFVVTPFQRYPGRACESRVPRQFIGGDIFSSGNTELKPPNSVDDVVQGLKQSTQAALEKGQGKLDVELPPGFLLGTDLVGGGKRSMLLFEEVSSKQVEKANRQLARTYLHMLRPMADKICIAFDTPDLAIAAKKEWKLSANDGEVMAIRKQSTFRKTPTQQDLVLSGEKWAGKIAEKDCRLLIAVAPEAESLGIIQEVSEIFQDNMGIILLNSRTVMRSNKSLGQALPGDLPARLKSTFVPSYNLRLLPSNGMLFHQATEDENDWWIVTQQTRSTFGTESTELLRSPTAPSGSEIKQALQSAKELVV
mmetsp:Transcript_36561/g.67001  ORF Transcript_36561/g.67001 Transcript_36561/m.67001 type:complete len:343 (-) Transcript_36561:32-1060(-)